MTSQFIQEKNLISVNIILSLINKPGSQKYPPPLSNLLVKVNHFGHREPLASKVLLILCLNLLCLFCFVKLMLISLE